MTIPMTTACGLLGASLGATITFLLFYLVWYLPLRKRALDYHKQADERLQDLEPLKMERDEWHQRCQFFQDKLAKLEEHHGKLTTENEGLKAHLPMDTVRAVEIKAWGA